MTESIQINFLIIEHVNRHFLTPNLLNFCETLVCLVY